MEIQLFHQAKPIWLKGKEHEKNCTAGFVCTFSKEEVQKEKVTVSVAVAGIYRIFLNGVFMGHGPARAAHGYYRVDKIEVDQENLKEENVLAIEVVNFYVNSFYVLEQPAFFQGEVRCGTQVICASGFNGGFSALELKERRRKVQRYSFQRPFIEAYKLSKGYDSWRIKHPENAALIEETEEKQLLERQVPWPKFHRCVGKGCMVKGIFTWGQMDQPIWQDRALFEIGETMHGYTVDELEIKVSMIMDGCVTQKIWEVTESGQMKAGQFYIEDMGINRTGFLGIRICCEEKSHVMLAFDEVLLDGDITYNRMSCVNAISLEVEQGNYYIETIQPYTCRYMKPMVLEGCVRIEELSIRELKHPMVAVADFSCDDEALNRIFEAGRETFAQNAVDLYMDCPSRERAGWLCDSFFTGRVELDLTGGCLIEENFLENYALPEHFSFLPDGMVAMCYPADHLDGVYIANWALWLILELYEFQMRSQRSTILSDMKDRVYGILGFMKGFENEDGLLEDVPGWVFVEWSKANELVDGVNFPSNMLYSAALLAAASLYGKEEYRKKGLAIRKKVQELSFDGEWFCDHAIRVQNKLVRQEDATEVCQYYAFFFQIANEKEYPELFRKLIEEFGPDRETHINHQKIWPANAFIGNYLRMELLSRAGRAAQILKESTEYFDYMAIRTGTLWENTDAYASCNHGFASHIIHSFYRDILGICKIEGNRIFLHFSRLPLQRCQGRLPVGKGLLEVFWERKENELSVRIQVPEGYQVETSCEEGMVLSDFCTPCEQLLYINRD